MATAVMPSPPNGSMIERQSLCLGGATPGVAIHAGEAEFRTKSTQYFQTAENNTAERLIAFKNELKVLKTDEFWNHLMEGLTSLCRAQFAFVSKRILSDDHDAAVEMPPIGEEGSCLTGIALYWNNGEAKGLLRDYKYYAWNAPCAYMRHDKIFLVPEGLSSFITDNPNEIPFECDAYLGIPLFAEGKCFAHFGVMWTKESQEQRKDLSWGYLEMMMHSLEDLITDRLTSGHGFAKINDSSHPTSNSLAEIAKVIPQQAITAAQSLRPYARSLSHELRTPMQGVVGMLDVMHATVQEQLEVTSAHQAREIFETLRRSIETIQDSSKRAVEAADNVVQAYALNMQVPDTPANDADASHQGSNSYFDIGSRINLVNGVVNTSKRRRTSLGVDDQNNPHKFRHLNSNGRLQVDPRPVPHSESVDAPLTASSQSTPYCPAASEQGKIDMMHPLLITPAATEGTISPGFRQSNIRDLIPMVIHNSLRVGGRPDSAVTEPTMLGEKIEVRSRSSNGHASQKTITWSVDAEVPDIIYVDERDVSKLISAVFLNAIKFTEDGSITLRTQMSTNRQHVVIRVSDTGTGIPEGFRPELFKPFSKEDHSITRSKEGLGLGLLVAKGTARRIGGDLTLVQSSTEGPNQGTEFEIRIPCDTHDHRSRSTTPSTDLPEPGTGRPTPRTRKDSDLSTPYLSLSPIRSAPTQAFPAPQHHGPRTSSKLRTSVSPSPPSTRLASSRPPVFDRSLAEKHPLRILVAEDNKINRKLLVNMLSKFGYKTVYEAFDGKEAVRVMEQLLQDNHVGKRRTAENNSRPIDVILMDLWMPEMDGYEATERILNMFGSNKNGSAPTVLAVSADVTEAAVARATKSGMKGYMTKPYKLVDLQRLIMEFGALQT